MRLIVLKMKAIFKSLIYIFLIISSPIYNMVIAQENIISIHGVITIKLTEASAFIEKSRIELIRNNRELSGEYIKISDKIIKTAGLLIENQLLLLDKVNLQDQLLSLQINNLKLQDEFRSNIVTLKSLKDQNILSDELSAKSSLDNLEITLSRINRAEDVDSTIYSSNLINQAYTNYELAKKYLKDKDHDNSIKYSNLSIEFADKAYDMSKVKYKNKEIIIKQFSNIFGFTISTKNNLIILSSHEIFSPGSSTIRFDIYPSLDKLADTLKNHDGYKIDIKATDNSKNKNDILSNKQISSLKAYFVSIGIETEEFSDIANSGTDNQKRKVDIILEF